MRVLTVAALLLAVTVAVRAQQEPAGGAPADSTLPVSADRVSEGLQRQEPIKIPPLPPDTVTFRSEVTGDWPRETALEAMRKDLAANGRGSAPSLPSVPGVTPAPAAISVDVLPMIGAAIQKFKDVRRAHAEENARKMVDEELAAFCDVHDCSQIERPPAEGVILPPR